MPLRRTPSASIAGFLANRSGAARMLAERYGAQVYPNFKAMLADVDVVDLCTRPTLRCPRARSPKAYTPRRSRNSTLRLRTTNRRA